MTKKETTQITEMRNDGLGYTTIASRLGLSKDCVRSFCRTHNLGGKRSPTCVPQNIGKDYCKTCGRRLEHTPGKRKKQYCSDGCRMDWWNAHQDQVERKAFYQFTCVCCGKPFSSYGNAKRSYCSHDCYIRTRFKKEGSR